MGIFSSFQKKYFKCTSGRLLLGGAVDILQILARKTNTSKDAQIPKCHLAFCIIWFVYKW